MKESKININIKHKHAFPEATAINIQVAQDFSGYTMNYKSYMEQLGNAQVTQELAVLFLSSSVRSVSVKPGSKSIHSISRQYRIQFCCEIKTMEPLLFK
jgi:hypothetical protein